MDTLTNFIEEHKVGDWCKRAAWAVVVINLFNFFLNVYSILSQNNPFNSDNTLMVPTLVSEVLRTLLASASTTLFYFFLLYAAGTLLNHMIAKPEEEEDEEEEEEIEQMLPGQVQ